MGAIVVANGFPPTYRVAFEAAPTNNPTHRKT